MDKEFTLDEEVTTNIEIINLICELKTAKTQRDIELIEEAKEELTTCLIQDILVDDWNETINDVKNGLYCY